MAHGTLYLVPTGLGATEVSQFLPPATLDLVRAIDYFVAENAKTARAFLKGIAHPKPLQSLTIEVLDEHTPASRVAALLQPLYDGHDCGVLSEAGSPAVADPGALLVRAAHANAFKVVPLVGPSALLLALMSSGMNGQRFAFHGYLPVERNARERRLAELEAESAKRDLTQMFIEAPYRNQALFDAIVRTCKPDTLLSLATDLTLPGEEVRTRPVSEWKREPPRLERRPTVFLLYRETVVTGQ
jgi:16S rRNA (cytidine1402-2'-O)-methyltransferase